MIDFSTAKPREVEGHIRTVILKTFGDEIENDAKVNASHGFYDVEFSIDGGDKEVKFTNFRKTDAPKIAKAIRALK